MGRHFLVSREIKNVGKKKMGKGEEKREGERAPGKLGNEQELVP